MAPGSRLTVRLDYGVQAENGEPTKTDLPGRWTPGVEVLRATGRGAYIQRAAAGRSAFCQWRGAAALASEWRAPSGRV